MSSVEVLGALDGYPPLLTIDEAAEVLRFGSCIRVPRWALAELLTTGRVVRLADGPPE